MFLNSLGITIYYYRPSLLEATFLSRQLDLYGLWLSTLVVLLVLTGLTVTYGRTGIVEWVPICALATGIVLLPLGCMSLATVLILAGQILALNTKAIHQAGSRCSFSRKRVQALMVAYLLSLVLLIEVPALIYWIAAAFWPGNVLGRQAAVLETNLTYAASSMSPCLYVALLFSWLWAPAVMLLRKMIAGGNPRSAVNPDTPRTASLGVDAKKLWSTLPPILILSSLSVFVGYYAYWHGPEWLVGSDVYWRYKGPLDRMAGMSDLAGFGQALREHQSGFLVLLFGLMKMMGFSSYVLLRYTPMVLTVMTALAAYGLASTLEMGKGGSLLSGLTSMMWVPTTIGIFTSILANWFALVLWTIFLTTLMKKDSKIHLVRATILGSLLSMAVFFIHPWSWGPFAAVTSLYLLTRLLGRRFPRLELTLCTTFGLVGLVAGCASLLMLQTSQGLRVTDALGYYVRVLIHPEIALSFADAIRHHVITWSPFLSPALMVMAIVGVLATVQHGGVLSRLMLSWLCATSVASILAIPIGEYGENLWRILFIAPTSPLTAIGASHICRILKQNLDEDMSMRLPSTKWCWAAGIVIYVQGMSILPVIIFAVLPELGQFLGLVLNLLLVSLLFHSRYKGTGSFHVLAVTIAMLTATSGLRSLAPLLVDPHIISLG
mgnify:CR=1 FL=1